MRKRNVITQQHNKMSTQINHDNFSIDINPFEEFDEYEEEYPDHSNSYNLSSKQLNNCQITNPPPFIRNNIPRESPLSNNNATEGNAAFLQKLATHTKQEVNTIDTTPPFARKKPTKGDTKYITNSYIKPLFLLDPITREIVSPNTSRYQEIYNILQNSHVGNQREFYNKYRSSLTDIFKWRKSGLTTLEQLYLLVLTKRFDKQELVGWKLKYYKAFEEFMEHNFPICSICHIPKMGPMCIDKPWIHPLYIRLNY